MKPQQSDQPLTRRSFLQKGLCGAGAVGATGAAAYTALRMSRRQTLERSRAFAYRAEQQPPAAESNSVSSSLHHYTEAHRYRVTPAEPRFITTGFDHSIWIGAGDSLIACDETGQQQRALQFPAAVRCLAAPDADTLYVGFRDHIEVCDARGQVKERWDKPTRRTYFTGMAFHNGTLFAADAGNRVILKYDRTGDVIGRIGEKDTKRDIPGFIVPSPCFAVAIDADRLLRVTNPGRHRVDVYTTDGDFAFSWGRASTAIDGFCGCCNPVDLAMLPANRCVTCEKGIPRVKVYDNDGKLESIVAGPDQFRDSARAGASADSDESNRRDLSVVADSGNRIHILDHVTGEIRIMEILDDSGSGSDPNSSVS